MSHRHGNFRHRHHDAAHANLYLDTLPYNHAARPADGERHDAAKPNCHTHWHTNGDACRDIHTPTTDRDIDGDRGSRG